MKNLKIFSKNLINGKENDITDQLIEFICSEIDF